MTAQPATDDKSGTGTSRPGQLITCVGLVAGALSLVQTIGHISDAAYLIPGLADGSGHVHYHLARETMVTLGSFGVILLGLFAPRRSRTSLLWWLMWISSLGLIVGILLARPAYMAPTPIGR